MVTYRSVSCVFDVHTNINYWKYSIEVSNTVQMMLQFHALKYQYRVISCIIYPKALFLNVITIELQRLRLVAPFSRANCLRIVKENRVSFETHNLILRVSCQEGPSRHAYKWQIGPFWQDTLDILQVGTRANGLNPRHIIDRLYLTSILLFNASKQGRKMMMIK